MLSKKLLVPLTLAAATIAIIAWPPQAEGDAMTAGKADLRSAGALELGPGNVLFVGDSEGAAVYALEVTPPASSGSGKIDTVEDLDGKIAALLGTTPRDVFIQDMAVHRPSGTAYLSITRGAGEDALPVIVQVGRDGNIVVVDLERIRHSRLPIAKAPAKDAKLYHWNSRTFTITDLEFVDGELLIAGLSNEEWASTLRRTPFPFEGEVAVTGLEIYHGAHGAQLADFDGDHILVLGRSMENGSLHLRTAAKGRL